MRLADSNVPRRINSLDRELRNFANAVRQLGSSSGVLTSALQLRDRLPYVLFLFHENAAYLFPSKIHRKNIEAFLDQRVPTQELSPSAVTRLRLKHKALLRPGRMIPVKNLVVEDLPDQMEIFAKDIMSVLDRLNEFPEFSDKTVNSAIVAFEADLKYWASCLRTYEGMNGRLSL